VPTFRGTHRVQEVVTTDHRAGHPPAGPEGFAAFVAARSPALVSTAWLLTGDHGRAEDLVQEALARTWQSWSRIRDDGWPEAYVRRTMVNLNISWWRRRWRGERPTAVLPQQALADIGDQADLRDVVRRALASLPPRQRAVVVLRYFEDWSEVQTAQALGCSVGTVKSQAARAVARLRADPQLRDLFVPHPTMRGER
jgi:RNA polymerase sigma-70 factor (sigma-E family)